MIKNRNNVAKNSKIVEAKSDMLNSVKERKKNKAFPRAKEKRGCCFSLGEGALTFEENLIEKKFENVSVL
jgi:hypothetical protein